MINALHRTNTTPIYSEYEAEDVKKDVDHIEEIKLPTDSTGVADLAGKKGKA